MARLTDFHLSLNTSYDCINTKRCNIRLRPYGQPKVLFILAWRIILEQELDEQPAIKSTLVSRNITVLSRRTSVRLEPEMWNALREIARREKCKIHDICSIIHLRKNPQTSLTAAIRVFLMLYYRAAATDDGHGRAGHGNFENMIRRARMTPDMLGRGRDVRQAAVNLPALEAQALAAH